MHLSVTQMTSTYSLMQPNMLLFTSALTILIQFATLKIVNSLLVHYIMKSTEVQTLGVMAAVYALRMTLC